MAPTQPVEHPDRLARFARATSSLQWQAEERAQSLQRLFEEVGELAEAEIRYYYDQRRRGRRLSIAARATAWVLGSLGLAAPLVAATDTAWEVLAKWGYVLLAGSASAIAANSLFGGSSAHARYVVAQLDLERLLTIYRLDWARLRSKSSFALTPEQTDEAFALIREFGLAFYKILTDETNLWGKALAEAIDQYSTSTRPPQSGS